MKINICTPTRGKADYLTEYVGESARNAVLPTTRFVLGFDADQEVPVEARFIPKTIVSVKPREDSLGEKYNRCAAAYDADLYIMWVDDIAIATKGWDAMLAEQAKLLKDGIGYIYFGQEIHGEHVPAGIVIPKRTIETIGYFCPPYFPFWFNNLWHDELGRMIGGYGHRILASPIRVRYPEGDFPEPPRRDVDFWADFFAEMRPVRVQQAGRLIQAMDDGPTAKGILLAMMRERMRELAHWNAHLRNPEVAAQMVKVTEPRDPRHQRLMDRARAEVEKLSALA